MKTLKSALLVCFVSIICILTITSMAFAEFPEKPITLVVGFKAGGGTDAMARAIGKKMEATLGGERVIIENRTGGAGGVAATYVMNQKPDGYTIGFVVTSTISMEPLTGKVKYNISDFSYLGMINVKGDVFLARADHGYKDFKGLIAKAKKDGYLRYGTITTPDKLLMKALAKQEGFEVDQITAGGGSATRAALKAGDAEVIVSGTRGLSFADANEDVIAVAALTTERVEIAPDLPTLLDLGYDLALQEHHLFFAPKGLPAEVAAKLEKAIQTALADDEIKTLIKRLGHQYLPRTGKQAEAVVKKVQEANKTLMSRAQ
jgi:tripartite-type tricarboxylate transporter receptor subunit TctC